MVLYYILDQKKIIFISARMQNFKRIEFGRLKVSFQPNYNGILLRHNSYMNGCELCV